MGLRRIGVTVAKLVAPLAVAVLPAMAVAQSNYYTEYNKTVTFVGVQGNGGYVSFTVAPTANCNYNNIYFDITTDAGKAYLSILLTARAEGKPLGRIDYTISSGMCNLSLAQL